MKPKLLAKELKDILKARLGDLVQDVVIFGSRIKRRARPDSDYDVLIVLKCENTRKIQRAISDICYDLDLKYDIFIDTQLITLEEMNNGIRAKHPVFIDALKEGVHA